ncbi:PAS domain-containing hybrid sensor histidine kinase/response regulator [Aurantiacibacter spongiae]|uniref:histidine kinase n=1 Tax=Aurantiacibacter spongiae TaxID=2488860 RepID=A0A3N5CN95_9SPHN|nr:PAS domain-containing hybrid sensor histidine kinase/response regulator [Aurantiacibacter spongiae]RPF70403.1 PAS domain-containing hybrid sensor histidine kinase/response regulator [Aurantiacibacter spongiae]
MLEHVILGGTLLVAAVFATLYFRRHRLWLNARQSARSSLAPIDGLPAGIWRTTADGDYIYVNAAWLEMTGRDDGDWQGDGFTSAIHPDDRERIRRKWKECIEQHAKFDEEFRWRRPDGSIISALTLGAPEFDGNGEVEAFVGITIDSRHSKALESDLRAELQRTEAAAASRGTFLANMSHEIRTPLKGVVRFTELLLDSDLTEDQRNQVHLIADSGKAMLQLLNDILDVEKIAPGHAGIPPEPTDLRQKLRHCAKMLEPMARSKGLQLSVFVDDAVPQTVLLDRLRLRQVVLNLVGNALKFTEEGGVDLEARVETTSRGRDIIVSVIDTGIGIDETKLETIFNPFMDEDDPVAPRQGVTGYGLTISSQLVTMMKGRITVHSKRGVGTNFTIRLPLEEVEPEKVAFAPTLFPQTEGLRHLSGARVLIAEDHAINQQLILAMANALGLDAVLAGNGVEAIEAVTQAERGGCPFHAVLMDVEMPDVDGLEATKRLRARGFDARKLPVIALTAKCYPEDIAACTRAGMQSHLGKPVTTTALARELTRWLSPARDVFAERPDYTGAADNDDLHERPTFAKLQSRYRDRKLRLVSSMRAVLDTDPGQIDWEDLASELRKLAGVAANFGDSELGEASRRLERRLKTIDEPHLRQRALQREWPRFEDAA